MEKTGLSPSDPSSFSRPELVIVKDICLNLNVNFDNKILSGNVILSVEKADENATELVLDSFKLDISSVSDAETGDELEYKLSDHLADYGSKLTIELPEKDGNSYKIGINYKTNPEASGIQWLSPKATAGKKHPFLFSQFQSSHARSVLPCQDTPAVKQTYSATISAPPEFTVLMSAICNGTKTLHGGKISHFVQKVPVPSYLIALAVGALESRRLGPRSHVWAEKELIEECAYEFADTEHQLKTAEEICGPYVWGIYDLLVLPPSFPYGGMENPCLTFVTPTLLAGDRSLANVVAHEIAHSWTGNLVTNRTYEHFWLNEGFTVFVERKIKGRLESPQSQDFDAYTSVSELKETIDRMGEDSPLTRLVVDLKGVHPDEAFSTVPYEKGQTFLRYLESVVGGPELFEPFLRKYFDTYKYKSIETSDFKNFFVEYFSENPQITTIDWDTWLYSPGMPPVIPDYDRSLATICDELLQSFLEWNGEGKLPIRREFKVVLTSNQMIYFLQKILEAEGQPRGKLEALDELFELDNVKNAEIKFRRTMREFSHPVLRSPMRGMEISTDSVDPDKKRRKFLIFPSFLPRGVIGHYNGVEFKLPDSCMKALLKMRECVRLAQIRWLRICLKSRWEEKALSAMAWINIVGRMKYVRPLYRDLYEWEHTKDKAVANFSTNRRNMMHVTAFTIAKDLHLEV